MIASARARSLTLALLCPLALLAAVAPVRSQVVNWPSEAPPRPLPAREVKFPPYEVRTLPNGMQVIAVLHHEQPAVAMRLLVRAGAAQDPAQKGGTAYLVSHLLDQGTATRTAEQVADQIDSIGGALGTGSGADLSFANVIVMKDSFAFGMELLNDVVRNPSFAQEEIERQKEQVVSGLQVNAGDPGYIASAVFNRLIYGLHPYGLPGTGTTQTVQSITREDLQAFHRRYFVPNNMVLAVVGDVTSEEAFAQAQRVFANWPRGEVPASQAPDPPPSASRIIVIDKPDAVQTEIRVGQLAIPRKHPDYLAWDLAVKILGGEGANRLHRVLRSERALTYGASADTEAMKQAGHFVAETNTRTDTTGEALRITVEEFARLQRQRVFEGELADAQAYLSGSFPLTIETPNDIATQVLNAVFYELPMTEISTFRERVLAVTPDDVQRVSRQYVRPDRLSIVLVGNARVFVPQLRGVGFSNFEVIPIDQLDLMAPTLKRVAAPPARRGAGAFAPPARLAYAASQVNPRAGDARAPAAAQTDRAASELLRRVVEGKGGLPALKSVRTVVAEADTVLHLPQGPLPSATKTYVAYPDRFRVDATVAGAEVVQVFNAGMAWAKDPGGVREAPPAMRNDFAAAVRRDTIPLLIAAGEGQISARLLADQKAADGKALKVLELTGRQIDATRIYIDDQMMIARQAYTATGPTGTAEEAEELFSDYRVVNGIRVPFQAELRRNGRAMLTRTFRTVTFNAPIADALFQRPQ